MSARQTTAPAATHSPGAKKSAKPTVAPPASPKQHFAIDSCLVGNWKDAGDVLVNTIDGQPGQFTGRGGGMEVRADGNITQQLAPETLTATIGGNVWAETIVGWSPCTRPPGTAR